MKDLIVLDLGAQFGLGCGQVFKPWESTVIRIRGLNQLDMVLAEHKQAPKIAVFGGGADIHPDLYGHSNVASNVGKTPSSRDIIERVMWHQMLKNQIPILGICRGAQLACALSGGWLIQNVYGHAGRDHILSSLDGPLVMSSVHHQMMVPTNVNHKLIAWTNNITKGDVSYDGHSGRLTTEFFEQEPEIVFFPESMSLAVQGHPEFQDTDSEGTAYCRHLIKTLLFKD